MPDQVYGVSWNGASKVSYTYDGLGRLTNKKTGSFNNKYSYIDVGTANTTTFLKSVTTPAGTYTYAYDKLGNIQSVSDGKYTTSYAYDALNQLVRENDQRAGKTYTYSYSNGNITSRKEYAYTTGTLGTATATKSWAYGDGVWKDLLTNYNGTAITYDTIGNPTKIGAKTLTWEGRRLTKIADGSKTYSYAYNGDGQRVSKTVNGTKTEYYYNGSILAGQKTGSNTLVFMYDSNGDPFGFKYNNTEYYYVKNAQNDVTAITDSAGKVIANYYYDAWGKLLSVTDANGKAITASTNIAIINPIRYRSYYYDTETGYYYVSSRYYDTEICRWINADSVIGQIGNVQSTKMFVYCFNNPVNMSDPMGNWPSKSQIFIGIAIAAVGVAAVAVTVATCGAAAPALAVAGGGVIGGISAGAAATAASVATGAMIVASVSTAAAVTTAVAEKVVEKTTKRNNSVYVLKDDSGTVQYVGRTNNVDKRRAAHNANPARAGLIMEVKASGLSLPEARALEQAGMVYYHTINTANKVNNQINSVSPRYWGAFKELASGTLNYGWNQMSNEILYWTGN